MNILITGANRGLGLALANYFIWQGHFVLMGCRNVEEFPHDEIITDIGEYFVFKLDVVQIKSIQEAKQLISERFSSIDILINNAGRYDKFSKNDSMNIDFEEIKKMYDVNAIGPLRMIKEFYDMIKDSKGKIIVNISSNAASIGDSTRSSEFGYCMSKAALNMETKLLQNFFNKKEKDIDIYSIDPGWMQTDMGSVQADYTASESAEKIGELILNPHKIASSHVDLLNRNLNW